MAGKKDKTEKKADNGSKKQDIEGSRAKRKLIPPFVMLTAGLVTIILMAVGEYELHDLLLTLFLVMLGFYILGCILKNTMDKFDEQNKPAELDEGEVIEKKPEDGESDTERSEDSEE